MESEIKWLPVLIILGYLLFRGTLHLSYPIWVFIHELGHMIPALLCGKEDVSVAIGTGNTLKKYELGSLKIEFKRNQWSTGVTSYKGQPNSIIEAATIILTAPVISLGITVGMGYWLLQKQLTLPLWVLFLTTSVWLANLHITFSSIYPWGKLEHSNKNDPCPHSDTIAFLAHIKRLLKND